MDRNITITSISSGTVNLYEPYTRLDITWEKKGAKRSLKLDKLREAIWSPGVGELFTEGFLMIDEPDAFDILVDLGLEQENAAPEERNIVVLTDAQRKRLLTTAPLAEFKDTFNKLNFEQRQQLADFAIANKMIDFDKCEYIKGGIGTDIISAVRLNAADEEK